MFSASMTAVLTWSCPSGQWQPSGGLAPAIDRGTPSGGVSKVCLVENPIEVAGRCSSGSPTPAVPGIPG